MARAGKSFLAMFLAQSSQASRRRIAMPPEGDAAMQVIWETVCSIPRGRVSTYGAVASAAGLPGRARLAGRALKIAPDAMNLPWHRVVGAGGRISFPPSSAPYREQARRLRAEGVAVTAGRVARTAMTDLQSES